MGIHDGSEPYEPYAIWEIEQQIMLALEELEVVAQRVREQAESQGIEPLQMRYPDGASAYMPILVAKSNLLPALYAIKKDKKVEEQHQKILSWFTGLGDQQKFLDDKDES